MAVRDRALFGKDVKKKKKKEHYLSLRVSSLLHQLIIILAQE